MLVKAILPLLLSTALSAPAAAAVMAFDALPNGFLNTAPYTEDGITVSGDGLDLGFFNTPGRLHLDDSGTSFTDLARFTTGDRFNAISFEVVSFGTEFSVFPCNVGIGEICSPTDDTPYDNVLVQGTRGGATVAEESFSSGPNGSSSVHVLSGAFRDLDGLIITSIGPLAFPNGAFCGAPCGHFELDEVTLNAVPAPAALLLLSSGIFLLGGAGWLHRRASA